MKGILVAVSIGVVACGAGSHLELQLSSSDLTTDGHTPTVQLRAGETRIVELGAIGAASGPATFSGTSLPAFATLQGPILTLAPQRRDAGDYSLTLMVKAGEESSSADLHLAVTR